MQRIVAARSILSAAKAALNAAAGARTAAVTEADRRVADFDQFAVSDPSRLPDWADIAAARDAADAARHVVVDRGREVAAARAELSSAIDEREAGLLAAATDETERHAVAVEVDALRAEIR